MFSLNILNPFCDLKRGFRISCLVAVHDLFRTVDVAESTRAIAPTPRASDLRLAYNKLLKASLPSRSDAGSPSETTPNDQWSLNKPVPAPIYTPRWRSLLSATRDRKHLTQEPN